MGSHSYYEFEPQRQYTGWLLLGFVIAVLALCAVFSSCSPTKRIGGLAAKHPDDFKRACAIVAPPEVKTVTNTEYIKGETVTHTDTVYGDCDPIVKVIDGKPVKIVQRVKMPCPPSSIRIDTIVKTSTVTIENKAKLEVLSKDLADSRADVDRLKKGRNLWRYIALGALVMLLGGAVLKLRKII